MSDHTAIAPRTYGKCIVRRELAQRRGRQPYRVPALLKRVQAKGCADKKPHTRGERGWLDAFVRRL